MVTTLTLYQGGTTQTPTRGDDLTSEELTAVFDSADLLLTFVMPDTDERMVEGFEADVRDRLVEMQEEWQNLTLETADGEPFQ